MIAPMPKAVRDQGPRVFCSRCPGASDSAISLSIDLQQKSWLSEVRTVAAGSVGDCDKSRLSPQSGIGHGPWWPIDGGRSMPGLLKPAVLAFRLAASQLLHFAFLRSARVIAGLLRFRFLASGAL